MADQGGEAREILEIESSEKAKALFVHSKIIAYRRMVGKEEQWAPGSETSGRLRDAVSGAIRDVGHGASNAALAQAIVARYSP